MRLAVGLRPLDFLPVELLSSNISGGGVDIATVQRLGLLRFLNPVEVSSSVGSERLSLDVGSTCSALASRWSCGTESRLQSATTVSIALASLPCLVVVLSTWPKRPETIDLARWRVLSRSFSMVSMSRSSASSLPYTYWSFCSTQTGASGATPYGDACAGLWTAAKHGNRPPTAALCWWCKYTESSTLR